MCLLLYRAIYVRVFFLTRPRHFLESTCCLATAQRRKLSKKYQRAIFTCFYIYLKQIIVLNYRASEILVGGFCYWVIRGKILRVSKFVSLLKLYRSMQNFTSYHEYFQINLEASKVLIGESDLLVTFQLTFLFLANIIKTCRNCK